MSDDPAKITIFVSGGVVTDVTSSTHKLSVQIIDYDVDGREADFHVSHSGNEPELAAVGSFVTTQLAPAPTMTAVVR